MFLKYLSKLSKKVAVQVEPHQLSLGLIAPRSIAIAILGIFMYSKYIQPQTRGAVAALQNDTTIFVKLLLKSRQSQKEITKYLTFFGFLTTLYASYIAKQKKFWILGTLSFSCNFLLDYMFLSKTQRELKEMVQKKERFNKKNLNQQQVDLVNDWNTKYTYKVFLSAVTIGLLFISQLKFLEGYNINLKFVDKLKKHK